MKNKKIKKSQNMSGVAAAHLMLGPTESKIHRRWTPQRESVTHPKQDSMSQTQLSKHMLSCIFVSFLESQQRYALNERWTVVDRTRSQERSLFYERGRLADETNRHGGAGIFTRLSCSPTSRHR